MIGIGLAMIIALISINILLFYKLRSQQKCIKHLAKTLNHLAQESASTHWTSQQNQKDLYLIKEALNLYPKEQLA